MVKGQAGPFHRGWRGCRSIEWGFAVNVDPHIWNAPGKGVQAAQSCGLPVALGGTVRASVFFFESSEWSL